MFIGAKMKQKPVFIEVVLFRDKTRSQILLEWDVPPGEDTDFFIDNQMSLYPGWEIGFLAIST